MKQAIFFSLMAFANVIAGFTQDITTMWPYKYAEFQTGEVYFTGGQTLSAPLNLHLLKSALHYLDKEQIKTVQSSDLAFVVIGYDKYYVRNDQLLRVMSGDSAVFLAELLLADFDAIMESGGAYGSSSNVQATSKMSSLSIGGINVTNHVELKSKKDSGTLLPIMQKYFFVVNDKVYEASRKRIESQLSAEKKESFKQFIKKHKIKWTQADSLIELLEFLREI
jgi:hypothetical protein